MFVLEMLADQNRTRIPICACQRERRSSRLNRVCEPRVMLLRL